MSFRVPKLLIVIFVLFSAAFAQERLNSLAINDELQDDAGPYYFTRHGDSSNAYAKAVPLARAMGITVNYDSASNTLTFSGEGTTARIRTTADVAQGLEKRSGVFTVDGVDVASPMAIIVDGTSYVPLMPIARAFEADTAWHSQFHLITVDMPVAEEPVAQAEAPAASGASGATPAPRFRVGMHDEYSRVAIDLDEDTEYRLAVHGNTMLVYVSGFAATTQRDEREGAFISSSYYVNYGDGAALVIEVNHDLGTDGRGFRVGRTADHTLYIDFAPHLSGQRVAQLDPDWGAQASAPGLAAPVAQAPVGPAELQQTALAAPSLPSQGQPVVVIDAGHGGRFAGARWGEIREEIIVLEVAKMVRDQLEAQGVTVIMTREDNVHLSEDYRGDLAARAAFATPDRNLFISIHANAHDNRSAQGIETFVFGQPLDQSMIQRAIQENGGGELGRQLTQESLAYANEVSGQILRETQLNYSRHLAHAVQERMVSATGAVDRGVKQNVFYVLRNARTPAILIELGFVSNPTEGAKLATREYQQTLARAISEGVMEFVRNGGSVALN